MAEYRSYNALFTLALGAAQCKAASKSVCHLVAMSLLRVAKNFFFLFLSCSVSFICCICCSVGWDSAFCAGGQVSRERGWVTLLCLL